MIKGQRSIIMDSDEGNKVKTLKAYLQCLGLGIRLDSLSSVNSVYTGISHPSKADVELAPEDPELEVERLASLFNPFAEVTPTAINETIFIADFSNISCLKLHLITKKDLSLIQGFSHLFGFSPSCSFDDNFGDLSGSMALAWIRYNEAKEMEKMARIGVKIERYPDEFSFDEAKPSLSKAKLKKMRQLLLGNEYIAINTKEEKKVA